MVSCAGVVRNRRVSGRDKSEENSKVTKNILSFLQTSLPVTFARLQWVAIGMKMLFVCLPLNDAHLSVMLPCKSDSWTVVCIFLNATSESRTHADCLTPAKFCLDRAFR